MICSRCGQQNDENTGFCLYCGEKLEQQTPSVESLNISQNAPQNEQNSYNEVINNNELTQNAVNSEIINENINIQNESIYDYVEPPIGNELQNTEEIIENNISEPQIVNPSITNPIAYDQTNIESENINILTLLLLSLKVIIKPGTTLVQDTKKYNKTKTGFFVYLIFSTITFAVYLGTTMVNSCFIQTYNINTGKYTQILDFGQLSYLNYTTLIIDAGLVSYVILIILIFAYYVASFLRNKGLSLGRYFVIISFSLSPFLFLTCAGAPIVSIINPTIGSWMRLFGIIYSMIVLLCTLNDTIYFKNTNEKILYHTIVLLVSFIVAYFIFSMCAKNLIGF